MVIDSSAILAILLQESEAGEISAAIARDPLRLMSTATVLEATIVIRTRRGEAGVDDLDRLLNRAGVEQKPFDVDQLTVARQAHRVFGKGRHPAGLNFGDCFAYALSKLSGEPLLFKGEDFARTDVAAVQT